MKTPSLALGLTIALACAAIAACNKPKTAPSSTAATSAAANNMAAPAAPAAGAEGNVAQAGPPAAGGAMATDLATFKARFRARMMRADTNGDGKITLDEWLAFKKTHPGKGGDFTRQFQRMDLNHDGAITPDELDARAAEIYAKRSSGQGAAGAQPAQGSEGAE